MARAERVGGEIADWIGLVSLVLEMRRDGILLFSGPAARLVARLCCASAVTLGPAVLFSSSAWREIGCGSDAGLVLLGHELVHIRQYRERGFSRFLWEYAREYLAGRLRGLSHRQTYREISFEQEARRGEAIARRLLRNNGLLRGCTNLLPS